MKINKLVDIPCHICGKKDNKCVTFQDCPDYKVPHESAAPTLIESKDIPEVKQVDYRGFHTKL